MFNNALRLNHNKNGHCNSCKSIFMVNRLSNTFAFPLLSLAFPDGLSRICYDFINPSPKRYLKISKDKIRFFIEYSNHSKKISTIIKDGYGKNSNLFGSIDGFTIKRYREPDELVSFELGKRHLISGYSDLWRSIQKEQKKSGIILDDLEMIIDEFKAIVNPKINSDFMLENNLNLKNKIMANTYTEKLFSEIFSEIKNIHSNNSRILSVGPNPIRRLDGINNNNYWGLFFTHSNYPMDNLNPDYFTLGNKENIEELKKTIEEMLNSDELLSKFKEFNEKKKAFDNLDETIYDRIDKLCHTVKKDKLD